MIMTDGHDGGIAEQRLLEQKAHIDGHLADAPMGNTYLLDKATTLIHQQQPELLRVEILHLGVHVVVDARGRA